MMPLNRAARKRGCIDIKRHMTLNDNKPLIGHDDVIYYCDQNPSGFWLLVQTRAFII